MKKFKLSIISILSIILLVFLDQLTKKIAFTKLAHDGSSTNFINHIIDFVYVENRGAAWGIFSGKMVMFYILTTILVIAIIFIYIKTPDSKKYLPIRITLVVLCAGAIGNFIDRLINGYVKDFIHFSFVDFPVFNVADMYVTCSMAVLLILIIFKYKDGDFKFLSLKKNKESNDTKQ